MKYIANGCKNKQLRNDISFARIHYLKGRTVAAERLEDRAFWVAYHNEENLRLVAIAVKEEHKGKGYGRFMLGRVIKYAREQGFVKIRTRTKDAVDFYQKFGNAKIIGAADEDYLMEMEI